MRIIQEFTDKEYKDLVLEFYNYFEDGYKFEEFLKSFLEKLGLTEVVVRPKSRDGGIDLEGIMTGISELYGDDKIKYQIQAKRYNPSTTISPEKIDALRGNVLSGEKGIFITTARVSPNAKETALTKDKQKPIFVIDGLDLVKLCIDKQFGFAYRPVFSSDALDDIMKKNKSNNQPIKQTLNITNSESVEKTITKNDIRCHMISVPGFIVEKIKNNNIQHPIGVVVNNESISGIKFCASRNYLSGVTSILRKYELLENDGSYNEKVAIWSIDEQNQIIHIKID